MAVQFNEDTKNEEIIRDHHPEDMLQFYPTFRSGDRSKDGIFEQIIATAVSIQSIPGVEDKRYALNQYLKRLRDDNWEVPMAMQNPTGTLVFCSKDAADKYVLCNVIHEVTNGFPIDEALQKLIRCFQSALKCPDVVPGQTQKFCITGPYSFVNSKFDFEPIVLKHGSFVVIAPSLNDINTVSHQTIIRNGEYDGMIVTSEIVNGEAHDDPIYQTFESIAYAIDQYSRLFIDPALDPATMDLFSRTFDGDTDLTPCLYYQCLVAGLAYDSPFWGWIQETGEIGYFDEDLVCLWQQHIERLLRYGRDHSI